MEITVLAGKFERLQEPVTVPLTVPADLAAGPARLVDESGRALPCQLTGPALLATAPKPADRDKVRRELHFILPALKSGTTTTYKLTLGSPQSTAETGFAAIDHNGEYREIQYQGRPVLRYVYAPLDESSKARRDLTYKVYHHLFDPDGQRLVTNGPSGLYPHHRGLFYGFNKITHDDNKKVDTWHCTGDACQVHEAFQVEEGGLILYRQCVAIGWHGQGKELFAREERELTVYHVPGGHLVEFASRLRTTNGPVQLDGDPQHAGFHFRADNEVAAKTSKLTYFIRPEGIGKPGETRNWPQDKGHVNLPWNAMSFVLGSQRYTAAYLDRPCNPKEARFSERDYGRFGSYFAFELTPARPLEINYRLWLQKGPMTVADVAGLSHAIVAPVEVTVK
jgi:hypothetical protein